jgi:hypothetical protein
MYQHKPEFIFFGESIPETIRDRSFHDVDEADRLLVMGTTLATYSAFRLVKRALDAHKPVLLVNIGPTRVDDLPGIQKVEIPTGKIIRQVARAVMYVLALFLSFNLTCLQRTTGESRRNAKSPVEQRSTLVCMP